jgi:hypothetical protein
MVATPPASHLSIEYLPSLSLAAVTLSHLKMQLGNHLIQLAEWQQMQEFPGIELPDESGNKSVPALCRIPAKPHVIVVLTKSFLHSI